MNTTRAGQQAKILYQLADREAQQRQYETIRAVLAALLGVGSIPSARRGLGGSGRMSGTSGTVAN